MILQDFLIFAKIIQVPKTRVKATSANFVSKFCNSGCKENVIKNSYKPCLNYRCLVALAWFKKRRFGGGLVQIREIG